MKEFKIRKILEYEFLRNLAAVIKAQGREYRSGFLNPESDS